MEVQGFRTTDWWWLHIALGTIDVFACSNLADKLKDIPYVI
jgi:hypothetical protein